MLLRFSILTLVLFAGTGCVSASQYDTLKVAHNGEVGAHQATREELARLRVRSTELEQRAIALESRLQKSEGTGVSNEREVAALKLQLSSLEVEKSEASQQNERLRHDLARVGSQLQLTVRERDELTTSLDQAEARAQRLAELEREGSYALRVTRDLAFEVHDRLKQSRLVLAVRDGRPELSAASDSMLKADRPTKWGLAVLKSVASVLSRYPKAYVKLTETGQPLPSATLTQRLKQLADALEKAGASPDRVVLELPKATAAKAESPLPSAKPQLHLTVHVEL